MLELLHCAHTLEHMELLTAHSECLLVLSAMLAARRQDGRFARSVADTAGVLDITADFIRDIAWRHWCIAR